MRVTVACIGRLKGAEQELCDRYVKRIKGGGRQVSFDSLEIKEIGESRNKAVLARKAEEASALLAKVPTKGHIFCMDEQGKNFSTSQFSEKIMTLRDDGVRDIIFILGGADGLSQDILKQSHGKISLGKMTMPHGLARVVLLEQLYRMMTLWAGHPYHRV